MNFREDFFYLSSMDLASIALASIDLVLRLPTLDRVIISVEPLVGVPVPRPVVRARRVTDGIEGMDKGMNNRWHLKLR